jgi:O-antigen/teichoic acid export membrane protein
MEEKAIRSVPWSLLSYAANKLIRVVAMAALARLLTPGDFGLVALAMVVIGALGVFADLGLGGVLVVRQDLDERGIGTVLTLILATAAIVTAVLAGLSPLAAAAFGEPRLTGVLLALSPTILIGGLSWFYETALQREFEFRRTFSASLVGTVSYVSSAVTLAALGAGVWSLVGGQLASSLLYTGALMRLSPYRVKPAFDRERVRELFASARGFLVQGGLAFFQNSADQLAIGRVLGAAPLGYYSMSYRLAELPYWGIANPVAQVTFPAFARMRHRKEDVGPPFLGTLRLMAFVTCPIGVILSGAARPFIAAVLGSTWLPMTGSLTLLGLWASVRTLEVTAAWLLNSMGEAGRLAAVSGLLLVPLVPGVLVAAHLGGGTAVAGVVLAQMVVSLAALSYFAGRSAGVGVRRQCRVIAPVAAACSIAWVVARLVAVVAEEGPPWAVLAASVALASTAYLLVLRTLEPPLLRDGWRQARRFLGRVPAPGSS